MKLKLFLALLMISKLAYSEPNAKLQQLRQDDGHDRQSVHGKSWDPRITVRDAERAKAVRAELALGNLREVKDFYAGAMILQHGQGPDDFRLANALSWIAYEIAEDKESVPAREAAMLYAMSWDRLMLSLKQKQWYKTQYVRDPITHGRGNLLPSDAMAAAPEDIERFSGPRY